MNNYHEARPWGSFEIVTDLPWIKTKYLRVNPGQRLSYQYHEHRSEDWYILHGAATITLDGVVAHFSEGAKIHIPALCKHRIENAGDIGLEILEVQTGTYFGEDDIIRIEDDYGR